MMKTKVCSTCKKEKPLTYFYVDRNRKDGYCHCCKKCSNNYCKQYHKKHKNERKKKDKRRNLMKNYGITTEEHYSLYLNQNGCCAICNKPINYDEVNTDHNHITGKLRELLCSQCNTGLGLFFTDEKGTELLLLAANYIRKHNG